jgi:hypothetical protein
MCWPRTGSGVLDLGLSCVGMTSSWLAMDWTELSISQGLPSMGWSEPSVGWVEPPMGFENLAVFWFVWPWAVLCRPWLRLCRSCACLDMRWAGMGCYSTAMVWAGTAMARMGRPWVFRPAMCLCNPATFLTGRAVVCALPVVV